MKKSILSKKVSPKKSEETNSQNEETEQQETKPKKKGKVAKPTEIQTTANETEHQNMKLKSAYEKVQDGLVDTYDYISQSLDDSQNIQNQISPVRNKIDKYEQRTQRAASSSQIEADPSISEPLVRTAKSLLLKELHRKVKRIPATSSRKTLKTARTVRLDTAKWMEGVTEDYYPLPRISQIMNDFTPKDQIVEINLSGLDFLTDLFFHQLMSYSGKLNNVSDVSLHGCLNVTDLGVAWLAETCKTALRKLNLNGCKRVTSHCLHYLSRDCTKLNSLDVTGTRVTMVPAALMKSVNLVSHGCPLLNLEPNQTPLKFHKLVIIRDENSSVSMVDYLTKYRGAAVKGSDTQAAGLEVPNNPPCLIKVISDWKLQETGSQYNVVETTLDIARMFISARCFYILPYDVATIAQSSDAVVARIVAIAAKVPAAYILLVGLGAGPDQARKLVDIKLSDIKEKLTSQIAKSRTARALDLSLDMSQQLMLTNAYAMLQALENLVLSDIKLDVNQNFPVELTNEFTKYESFAMENYPELSAVNQAFTLLMGLLESRTGVIGRRQLIETLVTSTKVFTEPTMYSAALDILHTIGRIVIAPSSPDAACILDVDWLAKSLNLIGAAPQQTGHIPYSTIGDQVNYWTDEQLITAADKLMDRRKVNELVDFLTDMGLLCHRRFLLLLGKLTNDPPPCLKSHEADTQSISDCSATCRFETGHVIPQSVVFDVIGRCMKLRPPVVLWKHGLVLHEGPVGCFIRTLDNQLGIELLVTCMSASDGKTVPSSDAIRNCVLSTANQYSLIIQATLYQHGLYATESRYEFGNRATSASTTSKDGGKQKGSVGVNVPYHYVTMTSYDGVSAHACYWCGLEGKHVRMLTELQESVRPAVYQHQALRALEGIDKTGITFREQHPSNTISMRSEPENGLKNMVCLEPFGFSRYNVLAGLYYDTAVGIQSYHDMTPYRLFLSRDKVLQSADSQSTFTELLTIRREDAVKNGDKITVALSLSNKADHYCVEFLKNDHPFFKTDIVIGDYIPFLAPAATYNASKPIAENQQMRPKISAQKSAYTPLGDNENNLNDLAVLMDADDEPVPETEAVSHFILDFSLAPVRQQPRIGVTDPTMGKLVGCAVEVFQPSSALSADDTADGPRPAEYRVATISETQPTRVTSKSANWNTTPKFTVHYIDGSSEESVPMSRLYPPTYSHQMIRQKILASNKDCLHIDELPRILKSTSTESYIGVETVNEKELEYFDWRKYLREYNLDPAFPDVFSVADFQGEFRPLSGFTSGCVDQCRKLPNRPIVHETGLRRLVTGLNKKRDYRVSRLKTNYPLCLLPELTYQSVLVPTRAHAQRLHENRFHYLCMAEGCQHFMNIPGFIIDNDKMADLRKSLMCLTIVTGLKLLDQTAILPLNVDRLVSIQSPLSQQQLEEGIREILFLTMVTYRLFVTDDDIRQALNSLSHEIMMDIMQRLCKEQTPLMAELDVLSESGLMTTDKTSFSMCPAHQNMGSNRLDKFPLEIYQDYFPLITALDLSSNHLIELPDEFVRFSALTSLKLNDNGMTKLPCLNSMTRLRQVFLFKNQLTSLPSMKDCAELEVVNVSVNPLMTFPRELLELSSLSILNISNTGIASFPEDIGRLSSLTVLICAELTLRSLPESFSKLTCLRSLDMSGLHWPDRQGRNAMLTREEFNNFMQINLLLKSLSKEEVDQIFTNHDTGRKGNLDFDDIQQLNATFFKRFHRFYGTRAKDAVKHKKEKKNKKETEEKATGFPEQILKLTQLEYLNLSYQGLVKVPDRISKLKMLKHLDVSNNPYLEAVPAELGDLPLESLSLDECPLLKTPPKEIVSKGFKVVYGYLKRLKMGSVSCKRTKLMMVGLGGAGKTSLVKALTTGTLQESAFHGEKITDGIDITTWSKQDDQSTDTVTFSVWDFAGQTVYYNTHQFFLSNRAIYLLLWNVRLGYEHAGLDFWCSSIACHAPKASILIVGSHCDKVERPEIPAEIMQKRYPQIKGFHFVSCYNGVGIEDLSNTLLSVALNEKYMGELIPEAWLKFETNVISHRSKSILSLKEVHLEAIKCGIISTDDKTNAITFLHELGSLQHFNNDRLRSRVVVDPQWIVDVMACVVSVHDNAVKDGVFHHRDIGTVWKDFHPNLHQWLLELTEEFDLTFRLKGNEVNLVPCLLPNKEPEVAWPDVAVDPYIRENKILYTFEYLPAGLFNRAQVRLCQFSDQSQIWRQGSLLKKNNHMALVQHIRDNELMVKVQGPRPENMLFFIHEVFESLIAESFYGVKYDYFIPCPDCLAARVDPCMFSAAKIRRAIKFKAPFLQCDKNFHSVTMTEMRALKPPEAEADYDAHLQKTSRELKSLQNIMSRDIFVYYCEEDCPSTEVITEVIYAHPNKVNADLTKLGYHTFLPDKPSAMELEKETVSLKASELILFMISDRFVENSKCMEFFYYVTKILRKKYIIVCIGEDYTWRQTAIGLQISTDVYVSMLKCTMYEEKLNELKEALLRRISNKSKKFPPVFISYCWRNSRAAGTENEAGLGWEDPRKLKEYLEKNGVSCWMDSEKTTGRLFEDIAEGLRHAKLMLACVSDEYVVSENCTMEFHFAASILRVPIVVVVVGKGSKWASSEIGLCCVTRHQVDFRTENPLSHQRLLEVLQSVLPREETPVETPLEDTENCKIAYTELFELGKRKFLRQIARLASGMKTNPYPRLIVVDILPIKAPVVLQSEVIAEDAAEKKEGDALIVEPYKESYLDPITGAYNMCFKLLCEHDELWHVVGPEVPMKPVPKEQQIAFVESIAGYMARLLTLLDTSTLDLNILNTECGNELTRIILDKCSEQAPPVFEDEYVSLRTAVMMEDAQAQQRTLYRCQQTNRKIVWLCENHKKSTQSLVLEDSVTWDHRRGAEEEETAFTSEKFDKILLKRNQEQTSEKSAAVRPLNRGRLVQSNMAAHSSGPDRTSSTICSVQ